MTPGAAAADDEVLHVLHVTSGQHEIYIRAVKGQGRLLLAPSHVLSPSSRHRQLISGFSYRSFSPQVVSPPGSVVSRSQHAVRDVVMLTCVLETMSVWTASCQTVW